ncbi:hypothetical protein OT109_10380 [Phycisphaeraceae bacterium D3-23]
MQNSIASAQSVIEHGELATAYDRLRAVITEAEEANVARVRDIRGPLSDLVKTLEHRAMAAFEEAHADYFAGNHEAALAAFEELAALEGLEAAREAVGELRKEDSRVEWRTLRDTVTSQIDQADFAAANEGLRAMERRARGVGYKDTMDELIVAYSDVAASHVEQARDAIEAERYDDAYGTLLEVSRLTPLRAAAVEARQLLGQYRNDPGMRQAQLEYESADMLADIKQELDDADGRNNAQAVREGAQRKLTQLVTRYEGTRAAAEAERLAGELSEQLAAR